MATEKRKPRAVKKSKGGVRTALKRKSSAYMVRVKKRAKYFPQMTKKGRKHARKVLTREETISEAMQEIYDEAAGLQRRALYEEE